MFRMSVIRFCISVSVGIANRSELRLVLRDHGLSRIDSPSFALDNARTAAPNRSLPNNS